MPLKMTKTALNEQARKPVVEMVNAGIENVWETEGSPLYKWIGNSLFAVLPTDEGKRVVEVSVKVRDLKIKPNKDADAITFADASEQFEWLVAEEEARRDKAETKTIQKEKLKEQDIARKAKIAAKTEATE